MIREEKYRCSRGHEWTQSSWPAVMTSIRFNHGPYYCVRCIEEFLATIAGTVEEMPSDKPDETLVGGQVD